VASAAGCAVPAPALQADLLLSTSPPTTSTPSPSPGSKDVAGLPGHRRRRHPRPLLLGQRGWLDPRARPRAGIPWEGNYSSWLEQKQATPGGEEKADRSRQAALERELEWIRMSPRARRARARLVSMPTRPRRRGGGGRAAGGQVRDHHPSGPPPRGPGGRSGGRDKDSVSACSSRPLVHPSAGGIVGLIGRNGAGKTTLFRMIVGDDAPDAGRLDVGPTVVLGYVVQSATSSPRHHGVRRDRGGLDRIVVGNRELHARAYCGQLRFQGSDQQRRWASSLVASETRATAKVLKSGANVLLLTSRPTTSTSIPCGPWRTPSSASPVCVVSSATPLVPRPHRHPCPGLRGRFRCPVVGGQLHDYEADRKKRLGPRPTSRTASATSRWCTEAQRLGPPSRSDLRPPARVARARCGHGSAGRGARGGPPLCAAGGAL